MPYDQRRNAVANDAKRYKGNVDQELKNCSDIGMKEYEKEEEVVTVEEEQSIAVLSASENVHLAQIDTTGDDLTHLQDEAEDAISMSPQEPSSPATDQIKDVSPMSPEEPSSDVFSADEEVDLSSVEINESKDEDESVDEDQSKDEVDDTSVAPENFFSKEQVVFSSPTEDEDEDVDVEIICHVIDGQEKTDADIVYPVSIKKEPIDEEYFPKQGCLPQEKTVAEFANCGPINIELMPDDDEGCLLAFQNYEESKGTEMDFDDVDDNCCILETAGAAALKKQSIDEERDGNRAATQDASTAHHAATNVNKLCGSRLWPFSSQDDPPYKKRAPQMELVATSLASSRPNFMPRASNNDSVQVKQIINSN